jgi:hypothetical protein
MSVNLNAQGMDSIESLLKLMTKVNPDMINPSLAPAAPDSAAMLKLPIDMDGEDDGDLDNDKSEVAPIIGAVGAGLGRAALAGASAVGRGAVSSLAKTAAQSVGAMSPAQSAPDDSSEPSQDLGLPQEDYANEPEEEVKDVDYILNNGSGGMNNPQGTYP